MIMKLDNFPVTVRYFVTQIFSPALRAAWCIPEGEFPYFLVRSTYRDNGKIREYLDEVPVAMFQSEVETLRVKECLQD